MNQYLPEILLADDSADDAELTIGALAEYNLANQVVLVTNGAEALDYLYRRGRFTDRVGLNPILFLLDLKMPRKTGHEVLEWLRTQRFDNLFVAVVSGSFLQEDIARSMALGADEPAAFVAVT